MKEKEWRERLVGRRIVRYEYKGHTFYCVTVSEIAVHPLVGITVSDGESEAFFTWAEIDALEHGIIVAKENKEGEKYDYYMLSQEEEEQEDVTEKEMEDTLDFLKSKGLLTDSTEDDEPAPTLDELLITEEEAESTACGTETEPTERKGSDIVRECKEAIENAFSDMLWDLSEHPARPSLVVDAHEEKGRLLTALGSLEEYYCITEGTEEAQ